MERRKPMIDAVAMRALVLFGALFAIGLATRFPAWQFPQFYALHGVLAAPFFAALARWHFDRGGGVWPLFAASAALAVVLGMMSPVMGLSFLLLALCLLAAHRLLGRAAPDRRDLLCAVAFGALDYPCALVAGMALGSYAFSFDSLVSIALLVVLAIGLSLFGALLMTKAKR